LLWCTRCSPQAVAPPQSTRHNAKSPISTQRGVVYTPNITSRERRLLLSLVRLAHSTPCSRAHLRSTIGRRARYASIYSSCLDPHYTSAREFLAQQTSKHLVAMFVYCLWTTPRLWSMSKKKQQLRLKRLEWSLLHKVSMLFTANREKLEEV
jgi:hypothetical protein